MQHIATLHRWKTTVTNLSVGLVLMAGFALAAEPITLPPGADFSILPPPPEDGSPAGEADLSVLLYVQAQRTPDQIKLAKEMADCPSVFAMGREIFGNWFSRENLPKTAEILGQAGKAANPVLQAAKNHWKRPRPYVRSTLVSPVVGKPNDAGSYPSGHSFGFALPQFVLSAAFPEHAQALDKQIHRMMWGRIVGGAHFPSDTEAGRILAKDVVEKMLKTKAMTDAIETIRAEAAPFLGTASSDGKASEPIK